ncbi:MAG: hypothetical protein E7161_05065 [Firmicutes bacterium]|nr:hypothetical protein [Bacillota bacterium]
MRKYIIPLLCYSVIILILVNINDITDFLAKTISSNSVLTIAKGNDYTKDYDFLFVKNSKDYTPYSYDDLIDILYSVINQGWEEFTFYCPSEYTDCIKDAAKLSKDELNLTHINNFVHPYNSFDTLQTSITESGEITINIVYLYEEAEIKEINDYVDNVIKNLYKEKDDDFENLKRIHDYIINNTKYDIARNDNGESEYKSFNAFGPAIEGYATCNGYADLMAIILSKLNYQNYKVATTSDEISYESNGHIWNALKIDDTWLHLDLTWDDPVSSDGKDYLYHKYFLVTTEEMLEADSGNVKIEEHNFNKSIYQEFKITSEN